ncbi:MAG: NAD(P)/FAD-dependent oxidoreductase [Bacteroidales bacterium]|nr:NAD(P)/FAD-dependent oxidoreductase [Bacteroidales bacterium]
MENNLQKENRKAVIIGAGPAGLTAAYELLKRTDIIPLVLEQSDRLGGISATVEYKGNRMDIGGHRFFSKSGRVMKWWLDILPLQTTGMDAAGIKVTYRKNSRNLPAGTGCVDPETDDRVMLLRKRLSRILYGGKFYDYPVTLNMNTLKNLGIVQIFLVALSYLKISLFPIKHEKSLEDFMINRFGKKLYTTFFRDYTEKVWGVPCTELSPEWGAQRIKGLSVMAVLKNAVFGSFNKEKSIDQKNKETSLIEQFLYPKFGPGQLWEETAKRIREMGGSICFQKKAEKIYTSGARITGVGIRDLTTGALEVAEADFVFSTMPVSELIAGWEGGVPEEVTAVAKGLVYRDFITIGLLLENFGQRESGRKDRSRKAVPDCWIYVQEKDLKMGRIQVFNNWSPYLVKDPAKFWVGLEYFCDAGDDLWNRSDEYLKALAARELDRAGLTSVSDVIDGTVVRMPKTYPAYFGTYDRFYKIREFLNTYENLFLIGRNGMHRYNNQDHSMLTAMTAVDNIILGVESKDNIWEVNTEAEYHEEK